MEKRGYDYSGTSDEMAYLESVFPLVVGREKATFHDMDTGKRFAYSVDAARFIEQTEDTPAAAVEVEPAGLAAEAEETQKEVVEEPQEKHHEKRSSAKKQQV